MSWWWNGTRTFDTPFALLYFHIPKCGGGSVVYWMMRHNQMFSLKLDYTHSKLFMEMHPDIFSAKWSGPMPVPVWKYVRVAVEYHASTERMYHYLIPRLRSLKAKYRAGRGRLVTFTTIVDPITVIKSFYQMWPPRTNNRSLVPLPNWLTTNFASGIITRSLSNGATGCNIQRAIMTLHTFDRIIFLRKHGNLTTFCDFLKWDTCPRFPYKHLVGPVSNLTRLEVKNTPRYLFEPALLCDRKMLAISRVSSQKFMHI